MSLREHLESCTDFPCLSTDAVNPRFLAESSPPIPTASSSSSTAAGTLHDLPPTVADTDYTEAEWNLLQPPSESNTTTTAISTAPITMTSTRWKKYLVYPEHWSIPPGTIPASYFEGKFLSRPRRRRIGKKNSIPSDAATLRSGTTGGSSGRCVGLATETIPFCNYHHRMCNAQVRCELLRLPESFIVRRSGATGLPKATLPPRSLQSFLAADGETPPSLPPKTTHSSGVFSDSKQMVLARWPANACRGRRRCVESERRSQLASFIEEEENRVYQQQQQQQQSNAGLHSLTPAELPANFSLLAEPQPTTTRMKEPLSSVLYWPAVISGVHGVFQGKLFESSGDGYRLLQMQEKWEDVELAALQAPMKVVVDVVFALDERTEAVHLTIFPESTAGTPGAVEGWTDFPDVLSMWNTSMEPLMHATGIDADGGRDKEGEENGFSAIGILRKRAAWCAAPVSLLDLVAGPVCQTRSVVFLRPSAEVVRTCRQNALHALKEVWDELQEHGVSASALRDAAKRRAVMESFCQPSEALPAPHQRSQDDSAFMVHHIPKLQSSTYHQKPAEMPADIPSSGGLPPPPASGAAGFNPDRHPMGTTPTSYPSAPAAPVASTCGGGAAATPHTPKGGDPMIAKPSTLLSTSAAATPATPMPAQVPVEPRKRQLEVHESGNAVRSPTTPMGLGGVLGRQRSPSPRPPPSAEEPREGSAPVRAQLPQEKRAQAALRSTPERGLPYRPRPFSSSRSPHRDQPPMDDTNNLDRMRAALQQPSTSSRRQLLPQPHRSTSQKSVESRGSSCCSHMSSYSRDGESPVLGGYQDKYRNEFTKPIKSRRSSEGSWGPRQPPNRSRSKSHS